MSFSRKAPHRRRLTRVPPPTPKPAPLPATLSLLMHRMLGGLAAIALLLSFFLSHERGLGIPCCFFRWWTELPCPGCGLTRSVIAMSHGLLVEAWRYHPAILLVYPMFWGMTLLAIAPTSWRNRLQDSALLHPRKTRVLVIGLWVGFGSAVFWRVVCLCIAPSQFHYL